MLLVTNAGPPEVKIDGTTRWEILTGFFHDGRFPVRVDGRNYEAKIVRLRTTIDPAVFEMEFLVDEEDGSVQRFYVPHYATGRDQGLNGYRR